MTIQLVYLIYDEFPNLYIYIKIRYLSNLSLPIYTLIKR